MTQPNKPKPNRFALWPRNSRAGQKYLGSARITKEELAQAVKYALDESETGEISIQVWTNSYAEGERDPSHNFLFRGALEPRQPAPSAPPEDDDFPF